MRVRYIKKHTKKGESEREKKKSKAIYMKWGMEDQRKQNNNFQSPNSFVSTKIDTYLYN